jgi:glyoxylase-like metal-dependent hydrolase (beta-lactamase superfamily II)
MAELTTEKKYPTVVPPTEAVDADWSISLGNVSLQLRSVGPNHTGDMMIGYVPELKLVYVVDFIGNESPGYKDLPGMYFPQYWESIDAVLEWDIEHATFGHGLPGTKSAIEDQAAYWRAIRQDVRVSIGEGLSEDEAVKHMDITPWAHWRRQEWIPMNVRAAYRYEKKAAEK